MAATGLKGRLSETLRQLLMRRATIADVAPLGGHFHLVTLEGAALRDVDWVPGMKVQIAMAAPFETRTFTPIEWDAAIGRTRLLGYAHGDGPGSRWLASAGPGDRCDVFGPRGSIELRRMARSTVLFGDETSIGLMRARAASGLGQSGTSHLEVSNDAAVANVLATLGLSAVSLSPRLAGDEHWWQWETVLSAGIVADAGFLLTGRAGTIQHLQHQLRTRGVAPSRILAKAYWAPGKRGLD